MVRVGLDARAERALSHRPQMRARFDEVLTTRSATSSATASNLTSGYIIRRVCFFKVNCLTLIPTAAVRAPPLAGCGRLPRRASTAHPACPSAAAARWPSSCYSSRPRAERARPFATRSAGVAPAVARPRSPSSGCRPAGKACRIRRLISSARAAPPRARRPES
eukprot:scaffold22227_cov60-Phaeocystis_antarctica.AAC.1